MPDDRKQFTTTLETGLIQQLKIAASVNKDRIPEFVSRAIIGELEKLVVKHGPGLLEMLQRHVPEDPR